MNDFEVQILPRAEQDIERNALWWAENHDYEQAHKWFHTVREQILKLRHMPESHGLSEESPDFPYELRDKLIGLGSRPAYRAVFTIEDNTVFVLAVLRSSQDTLLPDDVDF